MTKKSQCKRGKPSKSILNIIKKKRLGIKLDVGCGSNKQKGFVGLDMRKINGVDIVWDAEKTPYPLPKESCSIILASHLVEHICPKRFIDVMNEWWRLTRPNGQLWISLPYGRSDGFQQDPSHCNACNETTFTYFSPLHPLYNIYRPSPWKILRNDWLGNGNMEVVLEKMTLKEAGKCKTPKLQ